MTHERSSREPSTGAPAVRVEPMTEAHWPHVREIFAQGLASGHSSFETEPPDWPAFDASRLPAHRFVGLLDGNVGGWVSVSATSYRPVYAGVVEDSVYVATSARQAGVGRALLAALIDSTEAAGIWTIQAGIFPENAASIRLHLAAGFRTVGTRQRMGLMRHGPMAGRWRDVVLLERRSTVAGRDEN